MVLVVEAAQTAQVMSALRGAGEAPFLMGAIASADTPEAGPEVHYAGDDDPR
jgi:hypothetical protein